MPNAPGPSRRAVFLDRDGTLNLEKNYLSDPEQLALFPEVPAALKRLQDAGFLLFIVTNQSGIGRGYYTEAEMHAVNRRLEEQLVQSGVHFTKIYYAPEAPDQPSHGRKPSPQFLFDARSEFGVDLAKSYLVGDKILDLQCGWNAGVKASVLVRTGYGREHERQYPEISARAWIEDTLEGAATRILADSEADRAEAIPTTGRVVGLIPARFASSRFPGKALHPIAGKPLVQHVVERCRQARSLTDVIVATDDERIASAVRSFVRVEMTRPDHPSGTDRIAEVAARLDCDFIVNIQGDEPLIDPTVIDAVAAALNGSEMSTAAAPLLNPAEYDNPNVVKVVVAESGRALYFSRRTIPYLRDHAQAPVKDQQAAFPFLKHLGIYGYRREALLSLVRRPVSPLENAEKLEQLRALEHGIPIAVVKVNYESIGVDVPADVARVEALLAGAA